MCRKILNVLLCTVILFVLLGCSKSLKEYDVQDREKEITEITQQEGILTMSQFLELDELTLYFVWDENIFSIENFDEYAKVDITSYILVFDETGVSNVSSWRLDDSDDMRLSDLLKIPDESIKDAVMSSDYQHGEYRLIGYTNEEGKLIQEVLLTKWGYSMIPFYFEKAFNKNINGENYVGFYMVDEDGIQVCMAKCEDDVTIIFDDESDLIMNQKLQDVVFE